MPSPEQAPSIVVLALVQDGTGRASLKFEDLLAIKAFDVSPFDL